MRKSHFELLETRFDNLAEYLESILPSGSGIDCKWGFDYLKNGSVLASNSYHCMDDNGYYCGWADFTVKFNPYKSLRAFDLQFNGRQAQELNRRYMLREYLEDTIYHAMPSDRSVYKCLICE